MSAQKESNLVLFVKEKVKYGHLKESEGFQIIVKYVMVQNI